MNFSSILGVIAALVVFFASILTATKSREIFLDPHAILIVVGGTVAASLICFPLSTYFVLLKAFFQKILGKNTLRHERVIQEVVNLSRVYRENPNMLKSEVEKIKTEFLKEAIQMLTDGGIPGDALDSILRKRALTHYKRYEDEAAIFKTISKFPPAFGLMGTTLGMIALLQNLGSPESYSSLGPAMAIGLVATLYGIAITNLVLVPIAENLSKLNKEDQVLREMVMDGVKLVRRKEHPLIVEEHLKSYLLPSERKSIQRSAA